MNQRDAWALSVVITIVMFLLCGIEVWNAQSAAYDELRANAALVCSEADFCCCDGGSCAGAVRMYRVRHNVSLPAMCRWDDGGEFIVE